MLNAISHCGVQLVSDSIPKGPSGESTINISEHVIEQAFKSYNQTIEASQGYQDYLSSKTRSYEGPGPHQAYGSKIHGYLWTHSMRRGGLGKLAGLIWRTTDAIKGFFLGESTQITALEEIESFLCQVRKTANHPSHDLTAAETKEIHKEAKRILHGMLNHYDIFVYTEERNVNKKKR